MECKPKFNIASNVVGNKDGVWMILTILVPTVVMSKFSEEFSEHIPHPYKKL